MKQYSDFEVQGNITQQAAQGTGNHDVVLYPTMKSYGNIITVSGTNPYDSSVTTYHNGVLVKTSNGLVYVCTTDTPSSNSDFIITGKVYYADDISTTLTGTTFSQKKNIVTAGTGITIGDPTASPTVAPTEVGSATSIPKIKVDTFGRVVSIDKVTVYPPTADGAAGQVWKSDGSGAGQWATVSGTSPIGVDATTSNTAVTITHATSGPSNSGNTTLNNAAQTVNVTVDKFGHVTALTGKNISIGASQVSSGTLASARLPDATSSSKGAVTLVYATGESSVISVPTEGKMEEFVNSSVGTNTAYFKGTYDVETDLGLAETATQAQVITALNAKTSWKVGGAPTNNDYCFVQFDLSQDPGNVDRYDRYKYSTESTPATWVYEYTLNNSSFTADQWAAINSKISNSTVGTESVRSVDVKDIVTGPASVTNNHIATFDNAGNVIKDSGYTIATSVPSGAVFTDYKACSYASTSTKLFLVGAAAQSANATTGEATKSNANCYVGTDNHLYSHGIQTVNLSDTQALTNKTVNGLTLTAETTGFSIQGGTTSKKLIVNANYTLAAACAKGVTDSSSAAAIGTGTSLPTERDIYYGLPTINNSHTYTSSTTIYAPSGAGTANQVLKSSGGTSTPVWADITSLMPVTATDVEFTNWPA